MRCTLRELGAVVSMVLLASCAREVTSSVQAASSGSTPASGPAQVKREVRLTGLVEAVHSSKVLVPQIWGPGGALTLTKLIPNGSEVKEGDIVALFDNTTQADTLRDTQAKYDDLSHQVEQKAAQNRADFEKRASDLAQAEADLAKAEMELQKGPVLAEIDRLKDEEKVDISRKHVDSLKKSNAFHDKADAAALRILELQRDRQKVALERAQTNMSKLELKANLPSLDVDSREDFIG